MKKLFSAVLVVVMVLSVTSMALAASTRFNIVTDSTTVLQVGTPQYNRTMQYWSVYVDMSTSNISPTHRAVTRVHKGYDAASATWVYSGENPTARGYKVGIALSETGLTFRGRLDNRDSGLLEFHGTVQH